MPIVVLIPGGANTVTPDAAATTAFLARVAAASITLDTTHTNMYRNLINGLVTDSVFSKLDFLYFFATNAATGSAATLSLMNLVSASFTAIANGAPAFTADQGYTGVDNSTTVYLDTQFDPTVGTPNFIQDHGHLAAWVNNNVTAVAGGAIMGQANVAFTVGSNLFPKFSDGNMYFRTMEVASGAVGANATSVGHYVGNRTAATGAGTEQAFKNGVNQSQTPTNSAIFSNGNFAILAVGETGGVASNGSACQISAAHVGGQLTAADVTNLFSRLGTARTAVGL